MHSYSTATVTGVAQTKLINHKVEGGQFIAICFTSANEMSSTEP